MGLVLDSFLACQLYCPMPRVMLLSPVAADCDAGLVNGAWAICIGSPHPMPLNLWLSESELLDAGLSWLEEVFSLHWLRAVLAPLVMLCPPPCDCGALTACWSGWSRLRPRSCWWQIAAFPNWRKNTVLPGWPVWAGRCCPPWWPWWLWWLPVPWFIPLDSGGATVIWGWLTYRVFSFDALADHASAEERRLLMVRHRSSFCCWA